MSSYNPTRPADDRSQDFQSNPISAGSVQQRAVDPSFVNTSELGHDYQSRDKSPLESSAHNILPGHDHSKPLAGEQDSFVNIPGSFPGGHPSNQNQGLTEHHRHHQHHTTHPDQHKSNSGVSQVLHNAKETIGADIGSNNQYAKNMNDTKLYGHSDTSGRVNPDVSTTLRDTHDTIGADVGQDRQFDQSDHHDNTGFYEGGRAGLGGEQHHSHHHNQPASLRTHAGNDAREGNHDMSQLIHDIHRTSLDDRSTQNTDRRQVTGQRADDDISTRALHNAPMTSSHLTTGSTDYSDNTHRQFGNRDSMDTTYTGGAPTGFGHENRGLSSQTQGNTGLGSGIDSQINEYKRDISGPTEHTNVRSELAGTNTLGTTTSGLNSGSQDKHHSGYNQHAVSSGTAGGMMGSSAPIVSGHGQGIPHRGELSNHGSDSILSRNHEANKPHYGELTTEEVLTDSFGNPPHNPNLEDIKLVESNEITDITGQDQPHNRSIGRTFDPTNPQAEQPHEMSGVPNVAHNHDDPLAPSLRSTSANPSPQDSKSPISGQMPNNLPQGSLDNTGTTDHLNQDLHASSSNKVNDNNILGKGGDHSTPTSDTSNQDSLSTSNLGDRSSHNDNGLSDATNDTPIHRDESTNAETGTASSLGSMIMGKIKQAAGSILGNEQMKADGQETQSEARQDLHSARDMQNIN